jgi:hypothetical protein
MDGADIKFNAKLQMPVKIAQEQKPVLLEISDSLDAAEEKLRRPYKDKIAKFVDSSASWYPLAIEKIKEETPDPGKTRLLQIFILSEQDADSMVFGLEYRIDADVEHGRGLKIDGETFEILEWGIGEVAFTC